MFLTIEEMHKIYVKIMDNTATENEIKEFNLNLDLGCLEPDYVIERLNAMNDENN